MRCENKQCQRPYQYNKGKRFEFFVRPWTWGFSYMPGQRVLEFRWLCDDCADLFDVQQEEEWIGLVPRSEAAAHGSNPSRSEDLPATTHLGLCSLTPAPAES